MVGARHDDDDDDDRSLQVLQGKGFFLLRLCWVVKFSTVLFANLFICQFRQRNVKMSS